MTYSAPAPRVRTATCMKHGRVEVTIMASGQLVPSCGCGMPKGWKRGAQPERAGVVRSPGRSHFNAKRTTCALGHPHPSKVEARVCAAVYAETNDMRARIYRNVRLPLFALPPTDSGLAHFCNVDFIVVQDAKIVRLVDAKSGRRSRDWERGRAAVEASFGVRIEERNA